MWPDCYPASNIVINSLQQSISGLFVALSRSLHQMPWAPEQTSPPNAARFPSQCWVALHHPPCTSVWLSQSSLSARCPGNLWFYSKASLSLSGISSGLQTVHKIWLKVKLWKHCKNIYRKVGAGNVRIKERNEKRKPGELPHLSGGKSSQVKSCVRARQPHPPWLTNSVWPKYTTHEREKQDKSRKTQNTTVNKTPDRIQFTSFY